jgi:GNAT superfamily N-acetyltransferase
MTPSFTIRPLREADLPAGMRLKAQAGWNQTEADWRRLLDLEPAGCFAAEVEGEVVGTAVACLFGPVAWIAMMLVDEHYRGRGLGRALLEHALAFAEQTGARSIRLDATPMGRPLYEKLGFVEEFRLDRFGGKLLAKKEKGPAVEKATPADLAEILSLDRAVTRTDRGKLLTRLFQEFGVHFWIARREGALAGYVTGRPGARAWFLGPCIADGEAGLALLSHVAREWAGREVFVDIIEGHPATAWAAERGLAPLRPLVRMGRGPRVEEDRDRLWASSGPEKG